MLALLEHGVFAPVPCAQQYQVTEHRSPVKVQGRGVRHRVFFKGRVHAVSAAGLTSCSVRRVVVGSGFAENVEAELAP